MTAVSQSILVIEDDRASRELLHYLLSEHGYRVLCADRGDEGLDLARQARPDLILCDIQLPGIDGYGIAALLKADADTARIPLIALTALAMVGDCDRVLAAGFDAYASKPIDPSVFVARVEHWLQKLPS